jgi:hypothetical protein
MPAAKSLVFAAWDDAWLHPGATSPQVEARDLLGTVALFTAAKRFFAAGRVA